MPSVASHTDQIDFRLDGIPTPLSTGGKTKKAVLPRGLKTIDKVGTGPEELLGREIMVPGFEDTRRYRTPPRRIQCLVDVP